MDNTGVEASSAKADPPPDSAPSLQSDRAQNSTDHGISEGDIAAEMQHSGVSREEAASALRHPQSTQPTTRPFTVRKSLEELIASVQQTRTLEAPSRKRKTKIRNEFLAIKTATSRLEIETTAEEQENKVRYSSSVVIPLTIVGSLH